jgi:general secretion pathway protein H
MDQTENRAATALTKISQAATKPLLASSRGFTLMEIMIVVAIIAAVVAVGAPKLANQKNKMRGEIQRIAILSREVFNAARLQNRTFRIVFDMAPGGQHKYYVESAAGQATLLTEEKQKELDEKTSMRKEELAELNTTSYQIETKFVKQPEPLPGGLQISDIEMAGTKEPIKPEGDRSVKGFIHYFPQGLTQQALIHFTDGKSLNWTIAINPLTGKATVLNGRVEAKDIGI